MKTYGRLEVQLPAFLTSALDGVMLSDSRSGRLTSGYPLDRRLRVPQYWSGRGDKGKNSHTVLGIEPR